MTNTKTVGVITHCPVMNGDMTHEKFKAAVDVLAGKVAATAKQGYRDFVTDGSQGFAQMMFWAVDKAKRAGADVRNVLVLPFPDQDLRWLEDGCFGKSDYAKLLERADEVSYVTSSRPTNGGNVTYALKQAAKSCVEKADMVVTAYPGGADCDVRPWQDQTRKTVSLEAMRNAAKAGKPMCVMAYDAGKDGIVDGALNLL